MRASSSILIVIDGRSPFSDLEVKGQTDLLCKTTCFDNDRIGHGLSDHTLHAAKCGSYNIASEIETLRQQGCLVAGVKKEKARPTRSRTTAGRMNMHLLHWIRFLNHFTRTNPRLSLEISSNEIDILPATDRSSLFVAGVGRKINPFPPRMLSLDE